MNFNEAVNSLYNQFVQVPRIGSSVFHNNLQGMWYDEAKGLTDEEWIKVQRGVADKMREAVVQGSLTEEVLPTIDCIFDSLQSTEDYGRPMYAWPWAYYHAALNDHFDNKDLSPGDLVQCSIDQHKYPLGMHRVVVDGIPAISYTWENKKECLISDRYGNRWWGKNRLALIVMVGDDTRHHEYAFKCMKERRY